MSEGAIYGILKASVTHYTRCLATELKQHGVRVNCVAPGPTKTARFDATRVVDPGMMDSQKASLVFATESPARLRTQSRFWCLTRQNSLMDRSSVWMGGWLTFLVRNIFFSSLSMILQAIL